MLNPYSYSRVKNSESFLFCSVKGTISSVTTLKTPIVTAMEESTVLINDSESTVITLLITYLQFWLHLV